MSFATHPYEAIQQDLNNNDAMDLNDVQLDHVIDDNNNNNRVQLKKCEYEYKAIGKVQNYWAGPSYWKYPRNFNRNTQARATVGPTRRGRKRKQEMVKFTEIYEDDDDEIFVRIDSKAGKKINKMKQCNYRQWSGEKLKLPSKCAIPKDFFDINMFGHKRQSPSYAVDVDVDEIEHMDFDDGDGADDYDVSPFDYTYILFWLRWGVNNTPSLFVTYNQKPKFYVIGT